MISRGASAASLLSLPASAASQRPTSPLLGSLKTLLNQRSSEHSARDEPEASPADLSLFSRADIERMLRLKTVETGELRAALARASPENLLNQVSDLKSQLKKVMQAAVNEVGCRGAERSARGRYKNGTAARSTPPRRISALSRSHCVSRVHHAQKQRLEERVSVLEFEKNEALLTVDERVKASTQSLERQLAERERAHSEHVAALQSKFNAALASYEKLLSAQKMDTADRPSEVM
jgi:hypothetical protein